MNDEHMEFIGTIYSIYNYENGKYYIGATSDFEKRKKSHSHRLRNHRHTNNELQEDFLFYGEDAFTFDIIEDVHCNSMCKNEVKKLYLAKKESEFIEIFNAIENGYNTVETGIFLRGGRNMKAKYESGQYIKIFFEYHREGKSLDELQEKWDLSKSQLSNIVRGLHSVTSSLPLERSSNFKDYVRLTPEEKREVYNKYHRGDIPQVELAQEYNVSQATISKITRNDKFE